MTTSRRKLRTRLREFLAGGVRFPGYTPAWLARQAGAAALLALAPTLGVELWLAPSGRYLQFGQLWLLFSAGLLVLWTIRPLGQPTARLPAFDPARAELPDQPYPLADRWERRLSITSGDPQWYTRVVRDRLVALVAERFRQQYGSAPAATGADQVRMVLGDELHQFLTAPLAHTPSRDELDRLITRMEEI